MLDYKLKEQDVQNIDYEWLKKFKEKKDTYSDENKINTKRKRGRPRKDEKIYFKEKK